MTLATRPYEHGLLDLGNGGYAWLQPDGGWDKEFANDPEPNNITELFTLMATLHKERRS